MKKKIVKTIENTYDENGNLIKSVETITEEIIYTGVKPPISPSDVGIRPNDWNKPKTSGAIFTSEGLPPTKVTYGQI